MSTTPPPGEAEWLEADGLGGFASGPKLERKHVRDSYLRCVSIFMKQDSTTSRRSRMLSLRTPARLSIPSLVFGGISPLIGSPRVSRPPVFVRFSS